MGQRKLRLGVRLRGSVAAVAIITGMAGQAMAQERTETPNATSGEHIPQSGTPNTEKDVSNQNPQDLPRGEAVSSTAGGEASNEIVVTGTNISGVKAVGSEALVLRREDVLATGQSTVADVLRTLPVVQNAAGGNAQGTPNNGGASRGNAINLRGVGQGATLTLVDGHRVTPSGTASAFTEANQVPLAAVERIEVIADGASAIYGSDAIAGVINYVIRKNFTGVELGGRYSFGAFDNDEKAASITAGTHWSLGMGDGSILVSYEHSERDPYLRGRNSRLLQDQRPYGGIDNRVTFASGPFASFPASSPALNGNILVRTAGGIVNPAFPDGGSFTYYALPSNPTGRQLTAADLRVVDRNCVNTAVCTRYPNVVDSANTSDYIGRQRRDQAAVFASQTVGPISFYDEFFYTKSVQKTRLGIAGSGNGTPVVRVAPGNPNYIPGITAGPLVTQINLEARGLRFVNDTPDESLNNTFGARANLFADWKGEAYYTYGQDKACGVCYLGDFVSYEGNANATLFGEPILGQRLQFALQNAVDSGLVNPFSTAPLSQAAKDYILGTNSQYSQNYSHDVVVKLDGTLFPLPAGPIKAAVGGEYYAGIQKLQNGANRPPNPGPVFIPDANARTIRKQYAGFGEVYLPIIADTMDVPLVKQFTISAALRYDHYSDFGQTTNPKVSAAWALSDDLALRGSWGKSFRAPGLPELNGGVFSLGFGYNNPIVAGITGIPKTCTGTGAAQTCTVASLNIIGNNPDLEAERGRNWQIGADLTPHTIPGLKISGTYYHLNYANKLGSSGVPSNPFTSVDTYNQYQGRVIPLNSPANCNNSDPSTYDPKLLPFYNFLYSVAITFPPRNYCGLQAVVDGRTISAAKSFQDGLDITFNYTMGTRIGLFNFNASINKILHDNQVTVLGGPKVDILDTISNPISWRGRGNITYQKGPFALTLFGNYTGGYRNNQPLSVLGVVQPQSKVGSWTTFDLTAAVSFPREQQRWSFMRGVRLSLTVINLFDKDPPIVNSSVLGAQSIDTYAHNALGRYMQLQLTKAF